MWPSYDSDYNKGQNNQFVLKLCECRTQGIFGYHHAYFMNTLPSVWFYRDQLSHANWS